MRLLLAVSHPLHAPGGISPYMAIVLPEQYRSHFRQYLPLDECDPRDLQAWRDAFMWTMKKVRVCIKLAVFGCTLGSGLWLGQAYAQAVLQVERATLTMQRAVQCICLPKLGGTTAALSPSPHVNQRQCLKLSSA
jgi:hypothetical protein